MGKITCLPIKIALQRIIFPLEGFFLLKGMEPPQNII